MKSGSHNPLETSGPFQACTGIALPIQVNLHKEYYDYVSKILWWFLCKKKTRLTVLW